MESGEKDGFLKDFSGGKIEELLEHGKFCGIKDEKKGKG